jgi:hypothetical protein
MATFITVSQAESELLRRNRDQVAANRLQKVEGDEQATTGRAIRAAVVEQEEQPGGRRRELRRRDEPAASRIGPAPVRSVLLLEVRWPNTWTHLNTLLDPPANRTYRLDTLLSLGAGTTFWASYLASPGVPEPGGREYGNRLYWYGTTDADRQQAVPIVARANGWQPVEYLIFDITRPYPGSPEPSVTELPIYAITNVLQTYAIPNGYPVTVTARVCLPALVFDPLQLASKATGDAEIARLQAAAIGEAQSFETYVFSAIAAFPTPLALITASKDSGYTVTRTNYQTP